MKIYYPIFVKNAMLNDDGKPTINVISGTVANTFIEVESDPFSIAKTTAGITKALRKGYYPIVKECDNGDVEIFAGRVDD